MMEIGMENESSLKFFPLTQVIAETDYELIALLRMAKDNIISLFYGSPLDNLEYQRVDVNVFRDEKGYECVTVVFVKDKYGCIDDDGAAVEDGEIISHILAKSEFDKKSIAKRLWVNRHDFYFLKGEAITDSIEQESEPDPEKTVSKREHIDLQKRFDNLLRAFGAVVYAVTEGRKNGYITQSRINELIDKYFERRSGFSSSQLDTLFPIARNSILHLLKNNELQKK